MQEESKDYNTQQQFLEGQNQLEIAGFIAKTYEMLNSWENQKIIIWQNQGTQFIIKDPVKLEELVLPKYFRHNRLNSFIRQLNMYGFTKTKHPNMKSCFSHRHFIKDQIQFLHLIRRKIRNDKMEKTITITPDKEITKSTTTNIQINDKQNQQVQENSKKTEEEKNICKCGKIIIPMNTELPLPQEDRVIFPFMETQKYLNTSLTQITQKILGDVPEKVEEQPDNLSNLSIEEGMEAELSQLEPSQQPSLGLMSGISCLFSSDLSL